MGPDAAEPYLRFLTALTPATVGQLDRYCTQDVHFRDPFHDTVGVEAYRRVLLAMYEAMEIEEFAVTAPAYRDAGCHFEWTLRYRFRSALLPRAPATIPGATRLRLNADGLVAEHTDYWDAGAIYERTPGVGVLVRALKRRIAAG
jgi:steroid delta-isomerase